MRLLNFLRHLRVFPLVAVTAALLMIGLSVAATAAPVPPLDIFGKLPATEELELSPDGQRLAMVTTLGEKRILAVIGLDRKALIKRSIGETKVAALEWVGNDYLIFYSRSTQRVELNRYELLDATVINIKADKATPLLQQSPKYFPAIFGNYGAAQVDGAWHAYIGILPMEIGRNGASYFAQNGIDLMSVNLETGEMKRVARGVKDRTWLLDPSGAIVARSSYDDKSGAWTVLPPESTTPIASGKVDYNFATAGLGRTPGTILLRQGGTTGRVVELNLTTGAQEDLLPGGSTLIHAPQTGLLIGARVPEENKGLVLYDPVLEKRMASIRRAFKGASITLSSISADLDTVVVFIEDQDLAGTWQLVNFKTGKADPYADKYPDIKAEFIGPTKIYKYKAADGLDLDGVLTLPPGHEAKGLALVVLPHGGPESSDELGFDWWAQAFASRGYAVFQPNFRGSGGRGVQFRNAGFGQWGLKMQTDISDGVAALAAEGIVDPKRACIVGASYGGYAALAGVTVQQGLYRCAASYAGVSDPQAMLYADTESGGATNLESRRYWRSYLGISLNESVPDSITPTKMAAKADAPILLIHGDDDTVVSITQSEAMEAALRRAGKPVEFIKLKGEDHFLSRSQTRLEMLKAMMAFVQQHNPA